MIEEATGYAPYEWQYNLGQVYALRANQLPLSAEDHLLMYTYISHVLDLFGEVSVATGQAMFNRQKFKTWATKHLKSKNENELKEINILD